MNVTEATLIDYVMGALTPAEERSVVIYLKNHPAEAAVVRDYFEVLAVLALAQEPAHLPEDVEKILLERIRDEQSKD